MDDIISVGRELPRIARAEPLHEHTARIAWKRGKAADVDLAPALFAHRSFAKVRADEQLFRTLRVNKDGNGVVWDDGAELSSEWIERLPVKMDNQEFSGVMDKLHLSLTTMAHTLGVSRRLVADYRKNKAVPNHIAFAMRHLLLSNVSRKLADLGGSDPNAEAAPRRRIFR